MITMEAAKAIVLKSLPKANIISAIDEGDKYLFIAHWDDPLEGHLDPFFSVEKESGYFRDFSPQDYPDPLGIINKLDAAATDS